MQIEALRGGNFRQVSKRSPATKKKTIGEIQLLEKFQGEGLLASEQIHHRQAVA